MDPLLSDIQDQLSMLCAEIKLLNAKNSGKQLLIEASPWLCLKEAAPLLRLKSARALKARIRAGQFPPDCCKQIPTTTGKRQQYLVNVQRYLKHLN